MPRKRTNKIAKKVCVKCGKVLPLNDFYHNRDWADQAYRDAWCKKCANDFCTTRESLKEYCWYNNRVWSDEYYDQALNLHRILFRDQAEGHPESCRPAVRKC